MAYDTLVLAESPLVYWRLNETVGTTAADSSGNGHTGTHGGLGVTLGVTGGLVGDADKAAKLTFTANIASAASTAFALNSHPISATVMMRWDRGHADLVASGGEVPSGTRCNILTFWNGGYTNGSQWSIQVEAVTGKAMLHTRQDGVTPDPPVKSRRSITDGQWHVIVAEIDKATNTRNLYVDGVLEGSSSATMASLLVATGKSLRAGDAATFGYFGELDEIAVFDHFLGATDVAALWWEARQGQVSVAALDLGLTLGTPMVSIGQWIPATALDLNLQIGTHALSQPLRPGSLEDSDHISGVAGPRTPGALYLGSVGDPSDELPGIHVEATPDDSVPTALLPVASLSIIPGIFTPEPTVTPPVVPIPIVVPVSPTYPDGIAVVDGAMTVSGASNVTSASCNPTLNDAGSGQFTAKDEALELGDLVRFRVAGRTVMTGHVTTTTDHQVAPGEEAQQLVDTEVASTVAELDEVLILPDMGAMDTARLGPPTQDVRVFDWTANGMGDWSGDGPLYTPGTAPVPQTVAIGLDMLEADLGNPAPPWDIKIPLPDVWPDNSAQWMWWINPRIPAGQGWALFRVATPKPASGSVQFWLCAYDYAELWVDGVKLVTCDTPGKAMHIQVNDVRSDYHLIAIRAYTRGGRAGVLFSMLPVNWDMLYNYPTMNSRSGWVAIPYQDAFIYTPGAVLRRLFYEAEERGEIPKGRWELTFTNQLDSAGRPWLPPQWPIELDVGMSLLEALKRLGEEYIDWRESPSGFKIDAYIKGWGSGRSMAVPWTSGTDLLSRDLTLETLA